MQQTGGGGSVQSLLSCCGTFIAKPLHLLRLYVLTFGRDSSVGVATRYGLDGPGIESR